MHLKNPLLFGLMAILLLGGTITPVLSQSSPDVGVLINEVEINSNNGNEFVEIYNASSESIDLSGWQITPSVNWKKYVIPSNTVITPNSFLAFSNNNSWLNDFGETISLINSSGILIDQTPLLIDSENNSKTWQRSTDGFDTDSISDWTMKNMTPISSNGKLIESKETSILFSGQTDKSQYTFGDTITIFGSTSVNLYSDVNESLPEVMK